MDISDTLLISSTIMCLQSLLFLAPRPRRLRDTGGPGTQIEFALQIVLRSFARVASSFKRLPNAVSTLQEMFPNVSQTRNFAGGTNWREIRLLIQEPETASDFKM